jgi:ATP-binding cassette, subfamily B, bacterial MsbA
MQDFRRLLKYLKPNFLTFIVAFAAMIVGAIFETGRLMLIKPVFDQVLGGGSGKFVFFGIEKYIPQSWIPNTSVEAWSTIALLFLGFTLIKAVCDYFSQYLMGFVGQSAVLQLRHDLYDHLLAQSANFFERHRTNFLVSRLVTSSAQIELSVSSTLRDMLRESVQFIVMVGSLIYINWRLTLGAFLIAPIIALLTAKFSNALRKPANQSLEGSKLLTDIAQETLSNQVIVKSYRAEKRESERFSNIAKIIAKANLRSTRIASLSPQLIEFVSVISFVLLLFFGQREILAGRMISSDFLVFMALLFASYDPMRRLSRLHNALEQALAAARHVWEVLDENDALPEKSNAVQLTPLFNHIELKNVSFKYANDDKKILQNVSLEIPRGSMVALVGESGGGKSSLIKLIQRLYDVTTGAILWDGTDLREAKVESLKKQIALVTQETVLFNDTIRYNISYGNPDATDLEIIEAAKIAFAHDFIRELPNGYDTIVGERGVFLSGGQRQRIAIARAVLTDAPVLILDEATSALDTESEKFVQKALANLMQNRTSIVIAHRLSTIRKADKIVVMERGKIIQTGTHAELLAAGGVYKKLYELQFAEEEEGDGTTGRRSDGAKKQSGI